MRLPKTDTKRLKMPAYTPDLNQVDMMKYKMELESDDSFQNVFRNDVTTHINADMMKKCDQNVQENHNVLCIYGLTGKGKSMSGISIARRIFPAFKVNNIFFHNQEILSFLQSDNIRKPEWIIRDENIDFAAFGTGTYRIKAQLEAVTHTLRKKCISFTFISAPLFKLETAQYYFRALDMDRKLRVTRFGVQDPMTMKYIGAYYIKVMPEIDTMWIEYNRRKEEFMNTIMSGDYSQGKPEQIKMVEALLAELDQSEYSTRKERKIFIAQKYSNLTRGEIEDLSTLLEIKLRKTNEDNDEYSSEVPSQ